jgi:threonine/homoserine/homoserine lactone efflux protein
LTASLIAGIAAGLGVAIPFGAIAVLIVETGMRRGRVFGWAAGAGAATADLVYASLAAAFGAAMATLIGLIQTPLRWISVGVLVAIAVRGIQGAVRRARVAPGDPHLERQDESTARRTYLKFVGLTIINPMTAIYFVALVLALTMPAAGPGEKVMFVAGAGGASLCWQLTLGTAGSLLHRRVSVRPMAILSFGGYGLVLLIAANIALGLMTG